jgi:hypothetical protein
MIEPTIIAPSFAGQLRVAADDPKTTPGTMREAMRSAASVIDTHIDLIGHQQAWIGQLKLQIGAAFATAITALVLAVVSFCLWLYS